MNYLIIYIKIFYLLYNFNSIKQNDREILTFMVLCISTIFKCLNQIPEEAGLGWRSELLSLMLKSYSTTEWRCLSSDSPPCSVNAFTISIGSGKMMVEFFSAEIELRVCTVGRTCNSLQTGGTNLQVAQLQRGRGLFNDVRCLLQSHTRLLFSLRCDHLHRNCSIVQWNTGCLTHLVTLGFWRFWNLKMHPWEKVRGVLESWGQPWSDAFLFKILL